MVRRLVCMALATAVIGAAVAAPVKAQAQTVSDPGSSSKEKPKDAPSAGTPRRLAASALPGDLRKLHTCAPSDSEIELTHEQYARSVLFFVSCPASPRSGHPLRAVYTARDAKGMAARRLTFQMMTSDGSIVTQDAIPSADPAREIYVKPGDGRLYTRNDPPWIVGAWQPQNRTDVCLILAHWRVQGERAELWLWEEASECPKGGEPKYKNRLDKNPPLLMGRQ